MLYEMTLNSGGANFVQSCTQTTRSLSFVVFVMPSSIVTEVFFTCQYHFRKTTMLQAVMVDPVIAADGHTYERGAIGQWS